MNELTKEVSRKVMGGSIGREPTFVVDCCHIGSVFSLYEKEVFDLFVKEDI